MSETKNKTQRLASAVYLLTDFFDNNEPIKWKLRTLVLDLASERIKDKIGIVGEVTLLLSLAQTSSLVSPANYEILQREFSKFEKEIESPLNQIFFMHNEEPERLLSTPNNLEIIKDKTEESLVGSKEKHPLKEFGAVSVKKNSRQSVIINLLKRKKEIMIKDISSIIDGCSEKTIQRELLSMVASGVLKKIGEKRWSRYTLAHV